MIKNIFKYSVALIFSINICSSMEDDKIDLALGFNKESSLHGVQAAHNFANKGFAKLVFNGIGNPFQKRDCTTVFYFLSGEPADFIKFITTNKNSYVKDTLTKGDDHYRYLEMYINSQTVGDLRESLHDLLKDYPVYLHNFINNNLLYMGIPLDKPLYKFDVTITNFQWPTNITDIGSSNIKALDFISASTIQNNSAGVYEETFSHTKEVVNTLSLNFNESSALRLSHGCSMSIKADGGFAPFFNVGMNSTTTLSSEESKQIQEGFQITRMERKSYSIQKKLTLPPGGKAKIVSLIDWAENVEKPFTADAIIGAHGYYNGEYKRLSYYRVMDLLRHTNVSDISYRFPMMDKNEFRHDDMHVKCQIKGILIANIHLDTHTTIEKL